MLLLFAKLKNLVWRRRTMVLFASLLFGIYCFLAVGVYISESHYPQGNIKTVGDALWFPLITLTTIGYGDRFPVTIFGRVVTAAGIICGLGFFASFLAQLPSAVMERSQKREQGLIPIKKIHGHVIVCHWHPEEGPILVDELLAPDSEIERVVIVSEGERPIEDTHKIRWVSGQPSKEETLERAAIDEASAVISFPPQKAEGEDADGLSLILCMTVREMNSDCWQGVFIVRQENWKHFKNIGVKAIINSSHTGAMVMALAYEHPGAELVVADLLTNLEGSNLHRMKLPLNYEGRLLSDLYNNFEWIPVALIREGHVTIHPPKSTVLQGGDEFIGIV